MPYILFQQKKIFYETAGTGRPVFLLHGFAENGHVWHRQKASLQKYFRLIIPDIPGSGRSEEPESTCTIEHYAEAIKAIADHILPQTGDTSFSLIGHSMGGYIALAFAEKYSSLLNSIGLFHSSVFADSEEKIATRKKGIDFIAQNGSEAFLKISVPGLFSENTKESHPSYIEEAINMGKNIAPETLIRYYRAMMSRPERSHVIANFKAPVLFIIGQHDGTIPLSLSLKQAVLPPVSHIHILTFSAHMGMWEEDELSTLFLIDFLNNL